MAGLRTPGGGLPDDGDAPADAIQRSPGRGGGHRAGSLPRLWLVRARQGGRENTRQARCPGRGRSAHAGAGEELLGGGDGPAHAIQRSPGRGGSHRVGGTPRSWRARARRGRREDTRHTRCPGCGRSVHASAGGMAPDRQHAPVVAGLRTPEQGRSYLAVGTPRPMPYSARRGKVEVIGRAARPGRGRSTYAAAGRGYLTGSSPRSRLVRARRDGRGGHQTGKTARLWPVCARRGGR